MIPVIAEGVARLSNSRSRVLREKVDRLRSIQAQPLSQADKQGGMESVREEVKSRLWTMCQTTVHADPIVKNGARRNHDSTLNGSQMTGERSSLWVHEQSFGSQGAGIGNSWSPYFENRSLRGLDSEAIDMREEMNAESHSEYLEHRRFSDGTEEGLHSLGKYEDLEENFDEQMPVDHSLFGFMSHSNQREGMLGHRELRELMAFVESGSFSHQIDSLLDEDVGLPSMLANETDGSVDESEGDYFYVDTHGNCYQFEGQSFEDEESEWHRRLDLDRLADGHNTELGGGQQYSARETVEQY